jgi:hypothetical protein
MKKRNIFGGIVLIILGIGGIAFAINGFSSAYQFDAYLWGFIPIGNVNFWILIAGLVMIFLGIKEMSN